MSTFRTPDKSVYIPSGSPEAKFRSWEAIKRPQPQAFTEQKLKTRGHGIGHPKACSVPDWEHLSCEQAGGITGVI